MKSILKACSVLALFGLLACNGNNKQEQTDPGTQNDTQGTFNQEGVEPAGRR